MGQALVTDFYELQHGGELPAPNGMGAAGDASACSCASCPPPGFLVAAGLEELPARSSSPSRSPMRIWPGCSATASTGDARMRCRAIRVPPATISAVPEGRIVFANEPLLEVTAPIAEAQLVETFLLNQVTYQTAVGHQGSPLPPGRRRPIRAGRLLAAPHPRRRSRAWPSPGCRRWSASSATSNVEAARRYGLHAGRARWPTPTSRRSPPRPTPSGPTPRTSPPAPTFLVDTYDTSTGPLVIVDLQLDFCEEARCLFRAERPPPPSGSANVSRRLPLLGWHWLDAPKHHQSRSRPFVDDRERRAGEWQGSHGPGSRRCCCLGGR